MTFLLVCINVIAQPAAVQKAAKSVFTLTTFDKDGSIISSSQGVFLDNKGTAISTFKPFIGAVRGTVVDASGISHNVDAIMGANELYDVAKFRVTGSTVGTPQSSISSGSAWLVPYSVRKPDFKQLNISRIEKFNTTYNYYVFTSTAPDNAIGCPLVASNGSVIGIMHNLGGTTSAIDINYARQLTVSGMSTLDPALRQTSIRTALPDNENDAVTMMTLKKTGISADEYLKYANEYIAKFPTSSYGYHELALLQVDKNQFDAAEKTMQTALNKSKDKDQAHSYYAEIIYTKLLYKADKPYAAWTTDKARQEAETAYKLNPLQAYRHQQAQIDYLAKDYQKAYDTFIDLTKTDFTSGELWLEAAKSKIQMKAPDAEIRTLLDSAVSVGRKKGIVAPYYLARGNYLNATGKYREAVMDYLAYDTIAHPINENFFYTRFKAESNAHMWQLALLDIARCAALNPKEPAYFAEWTALDMKVGRKKEAISAAQQYVKLAPDSGEAYFFLGLAQIDDGQKEAGLKNLEQAKAKGESRADEYIRKYK